MPRTAQQILEEACQLPHKELGWLVGELLAQAHDQAFAEWDKQFDEPEAGYQERFRSGVEEALADDSGDVSHEEAMSQFHEAILRARRLKATA